MARGREFSVIETQLIVDNFDMTLAELEELFAKNGYRRSRKSISRKIEKMREEGTLGLRSASTVSRAYRQRGKKPKVESDIPSLRGGDSGFGSKGWDNPDWGSGWGDESAD